MKVNFYNISFREYYELEDKSEYNFALQYSDQANLPFDKLNFGDLTLKTFGLIKDLQFDLQTEMSWAQLLEYFSKLSGLKVQKIAEKDIISIHRAKAYLVKEIERINEIENTLLAFSPSGDEMSAGIDRFNKYGGYNQLRSIAKELNLSIQQVKELPYMEGLNELLYQKDVSEFQKDLNRIINSKNKQ